MNDSKRDPENDVELNGSATEVAAEEQSKKVLLGKRVIRAFGVRTGVRTGHPTSDSIGDWCGRSR